MILPERRFRDVETSLNIPQEYLDNFFHGIPIRSHKEKDGSILLATYPPEFIASVLSFLALHKTRFSKYGYQRWLHSFTDHLNLRQLPRGYSNAHTENLRDILIPNTKIVRLADCHNLSGCALWHGKNNGLPTSTLLQQIIEVKQKYPHTPIVFGLESDRYIQAVNQRPFADQNFRAALALSIHDNPFCTIIFIDTPQNPSNRADYWRDAYRRIRPSVLIAPDDDLLPNKKDDLPKITEIYALRTEHRVSQSDLRRGRLPMSVINKFQLPSRNQLATSWHRCPDCGI